MLQLRMVPDFNWNVLEWYGDIVPVKVLSWRIRKPGITKIKLREVVIQNKELAYTKWNTEKLFGILDSTYEK